MRNWVWLQSIMLLVRDLALLGLSDNVLQCGKMRCCGVASAAPATFRSLDSWLCQLDVHLKPCFQLPDGLPQH